MKETANEDTRLEKLSKSILCLILQIYCAKKKLQPYKWCMIEAIFLGILEIQNNSTVHIYQLIQMER